MKKVRSKRIEENERGYLRGKKEEGGKSET